ncbi:MAG: thrombospondin type 3 repeat-containing protein, partial [Duncaniella sp.]|nr:thrombospondin type 3 repeat-containing protein [Duncaniella sp.]
VGDIGGFPKYESETRPEGFDTDGDGMPDEWEKAYGLDPTVNDALEYTLDPRGWYTNIEVYANSLVESVMKGGNADAIDAVDEYYPELKKTSLSVVEMGSEVERIEYYDLNGIRLAEPVRGINIRRTVFTDGSVVTDKVIK